MPLQNYQVLKEATIKLCELFESRGFNNISVTNDPDYLELSLDENEREKKFPALILVGPRLNHNTFVQGQGLYSDEIIVDYENKTFVKKKPPRIIDVIYNLIILGETDQEVMNAALNVISIFDEEVTITVNNVSYRVYLVDYPDINNTTNDLYLIRAVCNIIIEGLELETTVTPSSGYIAENLIIRSHIVLKGGESSES